MNFVCMLIVTLLLCAFCAVSLLIMTWHYKRLLNASQTAGKPAPPPPPTQYYLGYTYACSLPLKAPPLSPD